MPNPWSSPDFLRGHPKALAAASRTARMRGSFRLFRRNSRGSAFSKCASSSICTSDARTAGVVVVKFPGSEFALLADPARNFDQTARTEISPGKFLFPRPHHLHRFSGGLRKTCRFDRGIGGVFSTVARAGVGNDHTNAFRGNSQCLR